MSSPVVAAGRSRFRLLASIRGRLLSLLFISVLPIAAVILANAGGAYGDAVARFHATVELASQVAAARHLASIEAAAQVLATIARLPLPGGWLAPGCDVILHDLVARQAGRTAALIVLDATGMVRCTSDAALINRDFGPSAWFKELRRTGAFTTGALPAAPPGEAPLLLAGRPLDPPGAFTGAIVATLALAGLVPVGAAGADPASLWLLDTTGDVLALGPTTTAAEAQAADLRRAALTGPFEARASAGGRLYLAPAHLPNGLTLVLAQPAGPALAAARRETGRRLAELTAFFTICLAAVALGASVTVIGPLQRLRAAVGHWREGEAPFDAGDLAGMPEEVRDLAGALDRSAVRIAAHEVELRAAVQQRDLLMAEIHHRVKNNLQVVSSLLNLQAQRIREPAARAEFESARDRVRALATLHRHLYAHQDHETIDLRAFIDELAGQIFQAMGERPGDRIALRVAAPSLRISSDQAVPLALIITEAMTNALKYAHPAGRSGSLAVTVTSAADRVCLVIRDDGVGYDGAAEAGAKRGLGGQLVRGLARQLGGTLAVTAAGGTAVTLDFPLRTPVIRAATLSASSPPGGFTASHDTLDAPA